MASRLRCDALTPSLGAIATVHELYAQALVGASYEHMKVREFCSRAVASAVEREIDLLPEAC